MIEIVAILGGVGTAVHTGIQAMRFYVGSRTAACFAFIGTLVPSPCNIGAAQALLQPINAGITIEAHIQLHVVVVGTGQFFIGCMAIGNRVPASASIVRAFIQGKTIGDGRFLVRGAAVAAVAPDACRAVCTPHFGAIVTAAVNVDLNVGDSLPRTNIAEDADRHRCRLQLHIGTVDALYDIDGHGIAVMVIRQLYLTKNAAYVVGTVGHLFYAAIVAAAVQVGRRTGNRIIEVARHAANSTGALAVVGVGGDLAKVIAVGHCAAVAEPVGQHTARVVGAAVEHRANIDTFFQRPAVAGAVFLRTNNAAYIVICCVVSSIAVIFRVAIVIRRSLRAAHKAAHGGKVDKAAGGCCIGLVLADDAAHGAPALVDVIGVDEPLAAGTVGDLAGDIVKAGDTAQVAVGKIAPDGAAMQGHSQLVGCVFVRDRIHAFQRRKLGLQVGLGGAAGLAGQHADHLVQVGVLFVGVYHFGSDFVAVFVGGGLVFIGHLQPGVDLFYKELCVQAAAGGDAAAVGAGHAAHKAAAGGDDTTRFVFVADGAAGDLAAVAAHDTADMGGAVHLGGSVLAGAHVGGTLHFQLDIADLAVLHLAGGGGSAVGVIHHVVAAHDAAHRAAHGGKAVILTDGARIVART